MSRRPAPATETTGPEVERLALRNGARVVSVNVAGARSLAAALVAAVGVRDEAGPSGLAMLTQRMLLRGTRSRPTANALGSSVEAIGGTIDSFVDLEYSALVVRCAADYAEAALDILLDAFSNPRFDPVALSNEKETLAEEARAARDTPEYRVVSLLQELLYGDQPLAREALGDPADVRLSTTREVRRHFEKQRHPSHVVAGIAGEARPVFRELLVDALEEMPIAAPAEPPATASDVPAARFRAELMDAEQVQICLGVPAYPLNHPDRYAISIVELALGGGMASRLFVRLRDRMGIAYDVSAYTGSYTDSGFLAVRAGVNSRRAYDGVAAVMTELASLASRGMPPRELEAVRALAKGRFLVALDDFAGAAVFEAKSEALEGQVHCVGDVIAGYDSVTREDVIRVANEVLDLDRLALAVVGPLRDPARLERLLFSSS